ncbi:MAG: MOSC domain-containing protein [Anderseniella sp.]|jgi:MOSC domain-containing protein YiiM|nr:MOSC domain-containing protein [Anderseniella sp.]
MAILEKSKLTGTVVALLSNPDRKTGLEKASRDKVDIIFDGIVGDCHSGRTYASDSRLLKQYKRGVPIANTRQLSVLSEEQLAEIASLLDIPRLEPEWVGANLVTSGIPDLTFLPPSTRMMFSSGATLIVDGENAPCRYVSDVINKHHPGKGDPFPKLARHKRGLVAWVEKEGAIAVGDEIVLHIPPQRIYSYA